MRNPAHSMIGDGRIDDGGIGDVSFDQRDPIQQIGDPTSLDVAIEHHHPLLRARGQRVAGQIRAEEARPSGYQYRHSVH